MGASLANREPLRVLYIATHRVWCLLALIFRNGGQKCAVRCDTTGVLADGDSTAKTVTLNYTI